MWGYLPISGQADRASAPETVDLSSIPGRVKLKTIKNWRSATKTESAKPPVVGEWAGGEWAGGEWAGGEWAGGKWAGGSLTNRKIPSSSSVPWLRQRGNKI